MYKVYATADDDTLKESTSASASRPVVETVPDGSDDTSVTSTSAPGWFDVEEAQPWSPVCPIRQDRQRPEWRKADDDPSSFTIGSPSSSGRKRQTPRSRKRRTAAAH